MSRSSAIVCGKFPIKENWAQTGQDGKAELNSALDLPPVDSLFDRLFMELWLVLSNVPDADQVILAITSGGRPIAPKVATPEFGLSLISIHV